MSCPCTTTDKQELKLLAEHLDSLRDSYRLKLGCNSIVNTINAAHEAIYITFSYLKRNKIPSNEIREFLLKNPSITAVGRHTKKTFQLGTYVIPARIDVIVNLCGIGPFGYGPKACIAKPRFAYELLQFMCGKKEFGNVDFLYGGNDILLFVA